MRRLTLVASLNSVSSYGLHAIQIVRGLKARGVEVAIRAISRAELFGVALPDDIKACVVKELPDDPWELVLHPHGFRPTPGKRTVYYLAHESTHLPKGSVNALNRCELVLTPSRWCETVLSASGVTKPIRVVPLGVDPDVFHYRRRKAGPFTFGTGGRMMNGMSRKGLNEAAFAFARAFPDRDDVRLRIKCFPDCPISPQDDWRVELIKGFLPPADMADWYASLDVFLSCAKGEGWGLMQHESMSCGRPVLGPAFGGVTDFFNAYNGIVVKHRLAPGEFGYTDLGHWAELNEADLIEKMRWACAHRNEDVYRMGMLSAMQVEHLTWDNSVDELVRVLEEFGVIEKDDMLIERLPENLA